MKNKKSMARLAGWDVESVEGPEEAALDIGKDVCFDHFQFFSLSKGDNALGELCFEQKMVEGLSLRLNVPNLTRRLLTGQFSLRVRAVEEGGGIGEAFLKQFFVDRPDGQREKVVSIYSGGVGFDDGILEGNWAIPEVFLDLSFNGAARYQGLSGEDKDMCKVVVSGRNIRVSDQVGLVSVDEQQYFLNPDNFLQKTVGGMLRGEIPTFK